MGFLDDLKKNLGLADKAAQNQPESGPGVDATVTRSSSAETPAEAPGEVPESTHQEDAAARAAEQRQAADESAAAQQATAAQAAADAVVNHQADAQTVDVPPAAEAVVEPVAEPELAEPVLAEPVLTEPVAAEAPSSASEVVVEQGDTMRGIATQYGVDLDELIAVNARTVPNPDHIYPGQVLHLP
ncbi:LysM peptidoglycan-binding domain-containing protein [Arthrobacter sp. B6]|uniref:LysM peptidoglycan-binding domain-containing protein n=1 Tax=Arthrobacter sp. B6 TaxID=1570137 RepID=UPI0008319BA4|nr:LysM peptidoglycan-binding domain-containing protein [Arthrobacter sp. B6]